MDALLWASLAASILFVLAALWIADNDDSFSAP
jgi:hypothetical protein